MRLFVAITLDDRVRSALGKAQTDLKAQCDGVRWILQHQVHMTVKFLGDAPDGDVAKIGEAVAKAAAGSRPFSFEIAGCGCFPPRGSVRIVWAGANEPSGALLQCVEALENEMESLGFPRERKRFSPHLTIGRVREDRSGGQIRAAADAHSYPSMNQSVVSLTLMSSVLSPQGPTYTPVTTAKLGDSSQAG